MNVVGGGAVCGKCKRWPESLRLASTDSVGADQDFGAKSADSSSFFPPFFLTTSEVWLIGGLWFLKLKRDAPAKRSDVIYVTWASPPTPPAKKYNLSVRNDEVGVSRLMWKWVFLEQCWWSVTKVHQDSPSAVIEQHFSICNSHMRGDFLTIYMCFLLSKGMKRPPSSWSYTLHAKA